MNYEDWIIVGFFVNCVQASINIYFWLRFLTIEKKKKVKK
jgi:hypothetical protein